jgi:NAD(P)-dependent dehydrogenase (short-subunit alcohol dehydrogenase family)
MNHDAFQNRTVIVTGGSSGIGRGIAIEFGRLGATVVIADVRETPKQGRLYETEPKKPTVDHIDAATPGTGMFIQTDIGDHRSVQKMVEEAHLETSRIDVVVNNAGIQITGNTQESTVDEWRKAIAIDLSGAFYTAKFAIPHLIETEGTIINIGSVRGFEGGGGPSYAAAKGGVVNLTRDLAMELGRHNVRVNCINPGYIKTPLQDYLTSEDIDRSRELTLLPRFGSPADIGRVAVFLASDDASYITGANIPVDGGWLAHSGV